MNLCVIDDRIVVYGEDYPSGEDKTQKIYFLNTNTDPWSLSHMLLVRGVKDIEDMCYMKTADGAGAKDIEDMCYMKTADGAGVKDIEDVCYMKTADGAGVKDIEDMCYMKTADGAGVKDIEDMCYMKTADGAACLLLNCPVDYSVPDAVEIVGWRIKWKVGKKQMGEEYLPSSICTDGNNTVYVADWVRPRIHILSREDGSVIRSINLKPYGIRRPTCIDVWNEHIYIGHMDKSVKKYQISKFTQRAGYRNYLVNLIIKFGKLPWNYLVNLWDIPS